MKRILIILLVMMMTLAGCSAPYKSKENTKPTVSANENDSSFGYTKPLTLQDVKTAFSQKGLKLSENKEINPGIYKIHNITPTIYTVKPNENIVMVYFFKSIALRKENFQEEGFIYGSDLLPQKENWIINGYTAKNILIVDMLNKKKYQNNNSDFKRTLKDLSEIVYSLNDSKQLVFAGKSRYWDARYTVKYYQHWYKDNEGTTEVIQYSGGSYLVKYLGSDPQSIRHLQYEYTYAGGGGKGEDNGAGILHKIGSGYYLELGNQQSGFPTKNDVYSLTINWNDQKESLHLKVVK